MRVRRQESRVGSQTLIKRNVSLTTHHSPFTIHHDAELTQLLNTYILTPSANGFILIHQQAAHERILYEQLKAASKEKPVATQRSMFPVTLELAPADAAVMEELMTDLQQLGYMIEPFGKNTFVIQGTPADVEPAMKNISLIFCWSNTNISAMK